MDSGYLSFLDAERYLLDYGFKDNVIECFWDPRSLI